MEAPRTKISLKVRGDKKLPEKGIERLLVRGTNWIGDVVMTLPALAAIRARWPRARISVLAKPWVAEVYRLSGTADEVIVFEEPGRYAGARGKIRLAGELRQKKFDCAILLQNAIEAAIIARLAGIPLRAGYNSDGRGALLTHSVRRTAEIRRVHQIDYYLEMVRALGCPPVDRTPRLNPGSDYGALADNLFSRFGISGKHCTIGISPGAAYGPAKRWFPERFAAVVDSLMDAFSGQTIVFGSEGDRPSAAEVQKNARHPLIDVAGRTNLKEAIALIARCDIFISNDSGLMHVAGALGVPTVGIFGSTNPKATSPTGEKSVVIHHDVACSPCLKTVCPTDFRCMKLITADEVTETARRLLRENAGARTDESGMGEKPAVFLDRDGTINEEIGYLDHPDKLAVLPGAARAIRRLRESGFTVVVVTNQSGVGRGLFDEATVLAVHKRLQEMLQAEGAKIDRFYYCPHHPTHGLGDYLQDCPCRKPAPGMLLRAAEEMGISLSNSWIIGDTLKDIEAGARAGVRGVLVKTGYGVESAEKLALSEREPADAAISPPSYVAENLEDAVGWILADREGEAR